MNRQKIRTPIEPEKAVAPLASAATRPAIHIIRRRPTLSPSGASATAASPTPITMADRLSAKANAGIPQAALIRGTASGMEARSSPSISMKRAQNISVTRMRPVKGGVWLCAAVILSLPPAD